MICQVIYATIKGDVTICAAYSHELPKYGMKAGLTNYAATYATGLLCARRLLTKYDLAETYEGNTENLGEDYNVEAEGDRRPFKCYLDTGLVRTSTGSRVFAALKGAVDGGLDIPHNDKRYAGYDLQDKSLDTETLERYIKGGVVAEYAEYGSEVYAPLTRNGLITRDKMAHLYETRPAQQAQMVADEGHGQVEPLGDVAHRDRRRDATQQDFQP